MKQYTQEKCSRLPRFYDRIETTDVVVDHDSSRFRTEIVVRTDHKHTFVVQVDDTDFYKTIDFAVDKLERQLREHKERHRNRKHPARAGEPIDRAADEEGTL